jgi:predicted transcriptional regulator
MELIKNLTIKNKIKESKNNSKINYTPIFKINKYKKLIKNLKII